MIGVLNGVLWWVDGWVNVNQIYCFLHSKTFDIVAENRFPLRHKSSVLFLLFSSFPHLIFLRCEI